MTNLVESDITNSRIFQKEGSQTTVWSPCRRKIPVTRGKKEPGAETTHVQQIWSSVFKHPLVIFRRKSEKNWTRSINVRVLYLLQLRVCAIVFIFHFLMSPTYICCFISIFTCIVVWECFIGCGTGPLHVLYFLYMSIVLHVLYIYLLFFYTLFSAVLRCSVRLIMYSKSNTKINLCGYLIMCFIRCC